MKHVISDNPNLIYMGNDVAEEVVESHCRSYSDNKNMMFFSGEMGDSKHMGKIITKWDNIHGGKNTIIL